MLHSSAKCRKDRPVRLKCNWDSNIYIVCQCALDRYRWEIVRTVAHWREKGRVD